MRRFLKLLITLVLAVVAIFLLFTVVFPEVERRLEQDPTLGAATSG